MEQTSKLSGLIVFYVNVGSVPPHKAQTIVENHKQRLKDDGFLDRMRSNGLEVIFMPNRELTHVELLKF